MPAINTIPSSIPAFIGYTQKRMNRDGSIIPGGTIIPVKIMSLADYENHFGMDITGKSIQVNLTETLQANNSLTLSAKASVKDVSPHILYFAVKLYFENAGRECYIVSVGASTGEVIKEDLLAGINALENVEEPDLLLIPEGIALAEADYYHLISEAIDHAATHKNRFILFDVHSQKATVSQTINHFRTSFTKIDHLQYAAVYYPALVSSYHYTYNPKHVTITIQSAAPQSKQMNEYETNHPYYIVALKAIEDLQLLLPASAAMAGIYADVDHTRGIWKAPANVPIHSVVKPEQVISNQQQDEMNVDPVGGKSINAIRQFLGKGILAWGARTLKGNDNEWKYISVRRFYMFIRRTISKGTQWVVFEPNDANTWIKLKTDIENFLFLQWKNGALQGAKPEHAYYVQVGLGTTMTQNDILQGRLIIEYGMAVVRPAEFIITRIQHKQGVE